MKIENKNIFLKEKDNQTKAIEITYQDKIEKYLKEIENSYKELQ